MPKFFVANEQIKEKNVYIVGEDVNHIVNVLRLQKNDEILVCNKDTNTTYNAKIINILRERVELQILKEIEETTESKIEVTIFQGLPKADKMEYIIQKSTELGVKKIVPVAMKRCIVKLEGKDEIKKIARWQKITEVAAKQSGRDAIPQIENIMNIRETVGKIKDYDLFLVAYEGEKLNTLKNELKNFHSSLCLKQKQKVANMNHLKDKSDDNITNTALKIGVIIGPEGGLEKQEVEELKQNGARIITLGNRILRTETASLVILSNIMYELEM